MDFYKHSKTFIALTLGLVLTIGSLVSPAPAEAGATLYFSPSSASLKPDQVWTVKVMVNTTESTAAIKYTVTFPTSILTATNASCGSTFSTTINSSIANGTVSGDCAALGQGNAYTGSAGHVATITFKAKSAGSGSLKFGASTVVRNGGDFGNMYTGGGTANVSVTAPTSSGGGGGGGGGSSPTPTPTPQQSYSPTPVPVTGVAGSSISSPSHPDQNAWYKSRDVEFNWTGGGDGFNFGLDQAANTQLPTSIRDTKTSHKQTVDSDGVWYFHVRKKSGDDWSATTHYRIQIDTTAPTNAVISVEPESPMTVLPTLTMSAEDSGSGIDRYEIKIGDEDWQKIGDSYKPKTITSGTHVVLGRAYDKAGNYTEVQKEISIVPLASPEIESPKSGLLLLGEHFVVEGQAVPNTTVEIYINDELKETVTSDKEGHFVSSEEYLLFPGTYNISARAVNNDGISSPMSESVRVTIDAQAVNIMGMVLPGWGVYGGVGLTFTAILVGLIWGLYRLWRQTRLWMGKVQWIGKSVDTELAELHQQLSQSIEENAASMKPETVVALKKQLEASVKEVEEDLTASLDNKAVGDERLVTSDERANWMSRMLAAVSGIVVGGVVWVASVVTGVKRRAMALRKQAGGASVDKSLVASRESAEDVESEKQPDADNQTPENNESSKFEKIPGVDDILGG